MDKQTDSVKNVMIGLQGDKGMDMEGNDINKIDFVSEEEWYKTSRKCVK